MEAFPGEGLLRFLGLTLAGPNLLDAERRIHSRLVGQAFPGGGGSASPGSFAQACSAVEGEQQPPQIVVSEFLVL